MVSTITEEKSQTSQTSHSSDSKSSKSPSILSVSHLKKTFTDGRWKLEVLKEVTFNISRGEWVAIMGPSGCGKTTLLNLIGLLDQQDDGKIVFEGTDTQSLNSKEKALIRSTQIGFVFQNHFLVPTLTVKENVELPFIWSNSKSNLSEIEERTLSAIKLVGLLNRVDYFPEELSGGEKQRISIARALVNKAQLVLLDEPTGNLDAQTGKAILDIFRQIVNQGTSIIMVTHDSEAARLADRILLLRKGNIIPLEKKNMDVNS
ncbi:MAG: ABC transporter ATP-binding protein [Candidatus Hodarchaeales archaeon]|jgi:putative ABC transport system ATP-binding protein